MNRDKILTAVFAAFIFGFAALFFALPKSEFSVNEKRTLASTPKFSAASLMSGSFEEDTETYLTDHFPFKDSWVAMNSYFTLYTGRNGANGVYKCSDGYLINAPLTSDDEKFEENMAVIRAFCEKTEVPVSVMIVPTTGAVEEDKLPKNHAPYNDDEYIDRAAELLSDCAEFIDVRERFRALTANGEQLFYKTDHHWTSRGAYEAYRLFCADALSESEFEIESCGGFYGTTYSKSAFWREDGETIELWTHPADVKVTISDGVSEKTSDDMFFRAHLDEADKYPVYLDGNHSYVRIENTGAAEGRLLLIKDSYAHCLAPFLALHNSVTDMVDLRYYLSSVSELVSREKYDSILIVYGLENLVEFNDINILE
ncbi:MAG: hypothetical protein LUD03_01890 [Firmicutes bacterium]|nr:hypothetical protein [Bacillota bacterium]